MWRAVDNEGKVLDVLVQTKGNKAAALKLMRASSFANPTPLRRPPATRRPSRLLSRSFN
jgi:hypothetical protein